MFRPTEVAAGTRFLFDRFAGFCGTQTVKNDFQLSNFVSRVRIEVLKYAVLCVYLPFECPVNEETYLEKLGVLQAILSELDNYCVSILGDWNADISDVNSMFATHLKDFCSDTGMVISDEAMLAGDTFTQLSERWHSTSWLDHCLSTIVMGII